MKKPKLFSYLLIIVSTSFFISCTRENVDYFSTAQETISRGQWSVDYYFAGQDKTAQFNSYEFNFLGNGTVTVNNGSNSIHGGWSVVRDVNRKEVLRINIEDPHFLDLNEQWSVLANDTYFVNLKGASSELRLKKL
jgi:hypothetical protein